ncbi:MAG: phosphopantetheine-binding protein [Desulfobulbaceae bacterium]|nr:phosphopantetheine-binding protein [Desulfobulbaceae bacterium]
MTQLEQELIELIVKVCRIKKPIPEDLDTSLPLIGPESVFGIDSLDAVEIVFTVQNKYKVRIDSEERSRELLASLSALADFIRNNSDQVTE